MQDCIIWTGARTGRDQAYGHVNRSRDGISRHMGAHRVAWAEANGIDPWSMTPDMVIMHTCDVPLCVNPQHLVLGTHKDNTQDAVAKGRMFEQNVTHCPQGHVYDEANTYYYLTKRHCRTCRTQQVRDHRRRKASA